MKIPRALTAFYQRESGPGALVAICLVGVLARLLLLGARRRWGMLTWG